MIFFKPSPVFVRWLMARAGDRTIIDVGCGDGYLLKQLQRSHCRRFLGVDRWATRAQVTRMLIRGIHVVAMDAQRFSLVKRPDVLLVIARPCHDGFVGEVLDVSHPAAEVLYISKPENVSVDIPRGFVAQKLKAPPCPEEVVYRVCRVGQQAAARR